jgi:hypothetical protein
MTTSRIAKVQEDGSVKSIYCHWDGNPSYNGAILFDNYQDPDKIDALLNLGDISVLGFEIGEKHDFDNPPKGVVNSYGRDRGETDIEAMVDESLDEFLNNIQEYNEHYTYLYDETGEWVFLVDNSKFISLEEAIAKDVE